MDRRTLSEENLTAEGLTAHSLIEREPVARRPALALPSLSEENHISGTCKLGTPSGKNPSSEVETSSRENPIFGEFRLPVG